MKTAQGLTGHGSGLFLFFILLVYLLLVDRDPTRPFLSDNNNDDEAGLSNGKWRLERGELFCTDCLLDSWGR